MDARLGSDDRLDLAIDPIYREQRRLWHQADAWLRARPDTPVTGCSEARAALERQLLLFSQEEALMDRLRYPARHLHAREHARIREYLEVSLGDGLSGSDKAHDRDVVWVVVRLLSNWLRKHIDEADSAVEAFFRDRASQSQWTPVGTHARRQLHGDAKNAGVVAAT